MFVTCLFTCPVLKVAVNMKSHSFDICTTAGTARATEKKTTETIPPKSSHTFLFPVVPLSTGEVTIEVTAELELLREVVIKTVIVEVKRITTSNFAFSCMF